ncbi:MAG: hypothetical protein IJG51_08435 [Synergistaceae bacterium]|nr:hypothetical protein [Synergistaceae bacterium]MBQ3398902.1 hypothetical protein [Synergistaceae bacterium]MBQ3760089.1 hypothetical protein [Synergistaceae bacterium]MBQ4402214.1 hypothetical protein [Synergistaceae bacterium]MBQ6114950.1 hypothetical protein [Synergistaceae bacterium]
MRKILASSILVIFMLTSCAFADVNPDTEIHKVMGGLYSLVSAIAVNGEAAPDIRALRRYFNDAPNGWLDTIRVERVGNDLWAGVTVGKYSTARKFLRSNAPKLGITDTPAGSAWMGGDFAWIKAGNISNGKFTPSPLKAAQSEGAIFFSTEGQADWWQSYPSLSKKSAQEVMKLWGVKEAGLHRPQGSEKRISIYDEVRPSEVRKPDDMHTNRKHQFGESYDIEMGDVIFKPVPSTRYRD